MDVDHKTTCKSDTNVFKINSGAIRFKLNHFQPRITLMSKWCPHVKLYEIIVHHQQIQLIDIENDSKIYKFQTPNLPVIEENEFYLCVYNSTIKLGLVGEDPFLKFTEKTLEFQQPKKNLIGFVKFERGFYDNVQIIDEIQKDLFGPLESTQIEDGQLRWVSFVGPDLPPDALIGGFEGSEVTYVARARHNGSLCPGKYLPSQRCAIVPWGHREHRKSEFEILCGIDAQWVKCTGDAVPENVFVAGTSEVFGEYLYVGRAMVENNLIVGKVHMLYKTCYLPYEGKEVEKYVYEILVTPNKLLRGKTTRDICVMNYNSLPQPCL